MKKHTPFIAALTIAMLFAGCGGGSGVKFSDLFDESAAAEGTGIQGYGLVRAVVILATHDATARQRQVAEQNGRRAVAKLRAQQEAAAPTPRPTPRPKKPFTATTTITPTRAEAEPAAAPKPRSRKKLPRIIAVATEKNEATSAGAAKAVMLFDTESQQIIGNRVYDIEREPRTGDEVRFETYSTSYVGAAL